MSEPDQQQKLEDVSVSPGDTLSMQTWKRRLLLALLPVVVHLIAVMPAEPVFNGDENRHVMTSVFFRDFLYDAPVANPVDYARSYYDQYPALGLAVWPPLFHAITGGLMAVFGTSVIVGRVAVFVSYLLAIVAVYRLCRRHASAERSEVVAVVFSLLPLVFVHGRSVLLEMPALAFSLWCIERYEVWLSGRRARDLYVAALLAACTALTRFDAVYLLPTLLILTVCRGKVSQLLTRHIPFAGVGAMALVAPVYLMIWREAGDLHVQQATQGAFVQLHNSATWNALTYYFCRIPMDTNWITTVLLTLGIATAWRKASFDGAAVFYALFAATYVTFSPLGELSPRHAIYWFPALAYFAVAGAERLTVLIERLPAGQPKAAVVVYTALLAGVAHAAWERPNWRVTGYAAAVQTALQHTEAGQRVLIDGWWEGNLTYHVRHLDPLRSRTVVRADQRLYDFVCVPSAGFRQFVNSDREILQAVLDCDPSSVIVETPQPYGEIEVSQRMIALMERHSQAFPPLAHIPVECNVPATRDFSIKVFDVNSGVLQQLLSEGENDE